MLRRIFGIWLLFIGIFLGSHLAHAADPLHPIKEAVDDVQQHLNQMLQGNIDTKTSPKPLVLPENLPPQWQAQFVTEPVFKSPILVVQAGIQHKQTVLLIHGLGSAGFKDWWEVIPRLETQYHVLTLDLPGFGHSSVPKGRYSPTHYADVLRWLVAHYAKSKVMVVGHSLGAAVGLRYAATYPDQVEKVVLADAAGILERTAFLKQVSAVPVNLQGAPNILKRATAFTEDLRDSFVELSGVSLDPTPILYRNDVAWDMMMSDAPNANAALALVGENFSDAIYSFPFNTWLIWGSDDRVAPLRTGKLLAARMPKAQLHIIEGAGHVPMKSHTPAFLSLLEQAFKDNSLINRDQHAQNVPTKRLSTTPQQDLYCKHKTGATYRGTYRFISMDHCSGIKLIDVQAQGLYLNESWVEIENTSIISTQTALEAVESVVIATNVELKGAISLHAEGSRLDLAGALLEGDEHAVNVGRKSRLIFSVSKISSPHYVGYVHKTYQIRNTLLDKTLSKK